MTNFHGAPGLEEHALAMKTLGDAILVRNRAIDALEVADNQADEAERRLTLTVVVAGAGFAGVETIGAVNDLLREAMRFYPRLHEGLPGTQKKIRVALDLVFSKDLVQLPTLRSPASSETGRSEAR